MTLRSAPIRSCVVCRNRDAKSALLRLVKQNNQLLVDVDQRLEGRGAYLCRQAECISAFAAKRAIWVKGQKVHLSEDVVAQVLNLGE